VTDQHLVDQLADVLAEAADQHGTHDHHGQAVEALNWLHAKDRLASPSIDSEPIEGHVKQGQDVEWVSMPANEHEHLLAEVERLTALVAAADEFGDRHVIDLGPHGFTLAHPLSCRAVGLFACPVGAAAQALDGPQTVGRFEATVQDGRLVIGDRIEATP
jgi:hypothetical protein